MEVCKICGLPKELCVCETIARGEQKLVVTASKRRFGKWVTVISGFDTKNVDMTGIAKKLKSKMACGGTVKEDSVELQGDHRRKIKNELVKLGFPEDSIDVK